MRSSVSGGVEKVSNSQQRSSSNNDGFGIEAPVINLFGRRPIFNSTKATHDEQRTKRLKGGRDEGEAVLIMIILKIENS